MKKNTEILSPREVADLLGLPLVTIQRWEHQGKIPFKQTRSQKWYKRKEIMEWAELHDMMIRKESAGKKVKTGEILSQAVERGGIHHGIGGSDVYTVFQHALDHLSYLETADRSLILNEMLNREELASTAIGNGIAIPHTRERLDLGLNAVYIPVLFLENPVEFNAIDGAPVFVLFMIFTANTGDHLKILSRIGYTLKDEGVVQILNERNRKNNLLTKISEIEQRIKK